MLVHVNPRYDSLMRNTLMLCLFLGLGLQSIAAPPGKGSQLRQIQIQQRNIVVRGAYLTKVEVWSVPTGTGITPNEHVLLGNATRTNAAGSKELWVFPIPPCDTFLATEVFAKGFDSEGTLIGKKSLPYTGASAVHDALCNASR